MSCGFRTGFKIGVDKVVGLVKPKPLERRSPQHTTRPLHQGAGHALKTKPAESLAKMEGKVVGLIPEREVCFSRLVVLEQVSKEDKEQVLQ